MGTPMILRVITIVLRMRISNDNITRPLLALPGPVLLMPPNVGVLCTLCACVEITMCGTNNFRENLFSPAKVHDGNKYYEHKCAVAN